MRQGQTLAGCGANIAPPQRASRANMAEILGNRFVLRYGYLAQMRQNRGHMSAISTIRNLGPATEAQFAKAGITSAEELRALGPDAAYRAWLLSGLPAHFIGYYVLVMALQDRPWNDCKGEEKKALRARFDALKAECNASGRSALETALNYFGVLAPPKRP